MTSGKSSMGRIFPSSVLHDFTALPPEFDKLSPGSGAMGSQMKSPRHTAGRQQGKAQAGRRDSKPQACGQVVWRAEWEGADG